MPTAASGEISQPSSPARRATRTPTDAAAGSQTKMSPNGREAAWWSKTTSGPLGSRPGKRGPGLAAVHDDGDVVRTARLLGQPVDAGEKLQVPRRGVGVVEDHLFAMRAEERAQRRHRAQRVAVGPEVAGDHQLAGGRDLRRRV